MTVSTPTELITTIASKIRDVSIRNQLHVPATRSSGRTSNAQRVGPSARMQLLLHCQLVLLSSTATLYFLGTAATLTFRDGTMAPTALFKSTSMTLVSKCSMTRKRITLQVRIWVCSTATTAGLHARSTL